MPKTELEQHIDFLLSAALRKCGSLEDAQDLAQKTLLSALTYQANGGVIEDMKAWKTMQSRVMNRSVCMQHSAEQPD